MVAIRSILDSLAPLWHWPWKQLRTLIIFFRIGFLSLRKPLVLAQDYTAVWCSTIPVLPGLRGWPRCRTLSAKTQKVSVILSESPWFPDVSLLITLFLLLESWVSFCLTLESQWVLQPLEPSLWARPSQSCLLTPRFLILTCVDAFCLLASVMDNTLYPALIFFPSGIWSHGIMEDVTECHLLSMQIAITAGCFPSQSCQTSHTFWKFRLSSELLSISFSLHYWQFWKTLYLGG